MNNFNKQPGESFSISIDFSNLLPGNEIISSSTVSAYQDTASVTTAVIDTTSNTSTDVIVKVKSGTNNLDYKITAVVTTSVGNIYEEDVIMQVREL
jgi:hypothetical protein